MNEQKTNISLELLLLNDLLRTNVIDKSIYDKAAQSILTFSSLKHILTMVSQVKMILRDHSTMKCFKDCLTMVLTLFLLRHYPVLIVTNSIH